MAADTHDSLLNTWAVTCDAYCRKPKPSKKKHEKKEPWAKDDGKDDDNNDDKP